MFKQVMVETVSRCQSMIGTEKPTKSLEFMGSVASLVPTTLYQGKHVGNHMLLWDTRSTEIYPLYAGGARM
jgi:hypothetical protein